MLSSPVSDRRVPAISFPLGRTFIFVTTLACSPLLFAQGPDGNGPPKTSWSLGVGAISMQKPYAGVDRKSILLPVIQFENRYVHIFGPHIGLKLPSLDITKTQQLNFSLVGKWDGSGYKAKDAPILGDMHDRKSGFWVGAEVEWKHDLADVKAAWLTDASGNSKGQQFSIGLEKTWHIGNHFMLTPRVEATWHDRKYVDYYFGVRDSEARADRPVHTGKAGITAEVGMRGIYKFDKQHALFMDIAVSHLPQAVKDSPLVDRSTENRVMLGYMYRFR